MESKLEELRKLLYEKEKNTKNDVSEQEKINNLKFLLNQEKIFFKLEIPVALGILEYLGISEDNMYDYYMSLISPEEFMKKIK